MPLIPQSGGYPPEDQGGETPEDLVRAAIEYAQMALQQLPDDLESADLTKAIGFLYKVMGNRQKEQEAAMGTTPAMKFMSRG